MPVPYLFHEQVSPTIGTRINANFLDKHLLEECDKRGLDMESFIWDGKYLFAYHPEKQYYYRIMISDL